MSYRNKVWFHDQYIIILCLPEAKTNICKEQTNRYVDKKLFGEVVRSQSEAESSRKRTMEGDRDEGLWLKGAGGWRGCRDPK